MIHLCNEFAVDVGSTTARFLEYLDKTGQDLVIMPRKPEELPKAGTAQTHVRQVSGTVANVGYGRLEKIHQVGRDTKAFHSSCSTVSLVELPITSNISKLWTQRHTLAIKKYLSSVCPQTESLVRVGDLGIKSARGTDRVGVILTLTYNLSSTRVAKKKQELKCYVLPYTVYSKLKEYKPSVSADLLIIRDQQGNCKHFKIN